MQAGELEEAELLGQREELEHASIALRGGVDPRQHGAVGRGEAGDAVGWEATDDDAAAEHGDAGEVACQPQHEGGGHRGVAVVDVEAQRLRVGEGRAGGLGGLEHDGDLRLLRDGLVEAGVGDGERPQVDVEAGPEATRGAADWPRE